MARLFNRPYSRCISGFISRMARSVVFCRLLLFCNTLIRYLVSSVTLLDVTERERERERETERVKSFRI